MARDRGNRPKRDHKQQQYSRHRRQAKQVQRLEDAESKRQSLDDAWDAVKKIYDSPDRDSTKAISAANNIREAERSLNMTEQRHNQDESRES